MSETVTYKGKVRKLASGEDTEKYCEKIASDLKMDLEEYYADTYTDLINGELSNYEVVYGNLYQILEKNELSEIDLFNVVELPNGDFEFLVQYYNGVMGFNDALEEAFKNKIN